MGANQGQGYAGVGNKTHCRPDGPRRPLPAGRGPRARRHGRGGAAEDLRLGRPVAVKLLRADLADDADIRRRFESEARAAAGISHPHAVAVFDAGEDEGVAYLVMERLPGDTLADEMATGPLDQPGPVPSPARSSAPSAPPTIAA